MQAFFDGNKHERLKDLSSHFKMSKLAYMPFVGIDQCNDIYAISGLNQ